MQLCWAWNNYCPKVSGWGVGVSGLDAFRFFLPGSGPQPQRPKQPGSGCLIHAFRAKCKGE